jgi:hypothetical protein
MNVKEVSMSKIAVWADYDWCWLDNIDEYLVFKSDDYVIKQLPHCMDYPTFDFLVSSANGVV